MNLLVERETEGAENIGKEDKKREGKGRGRRLVSGEGKTLSSGPDWVCEEWPH